MNLQIAFVAIVLIGFLPESLSGQIPSADDIRRANLAEREYIYGKELEYEIVTRVLPSPDGNTFYSLHEAIASTGTRKLTIGRPRRGRSYVPTLLMHYQPNKGEPHLDEDPLLTFFQGFDGRATHTYERRLLADYQFKEPFESSGTQQLGASIGAFIDDPMVRLLVNRTEPFFGRVLKDYPFVELGNELKAERYDHAADANAIRVSTTDPNDESYFIVSSEPSFLILERLSANPNSLPLVEVSELKSFDGNVYPGRGIVRSLSDDGKTGWESTINLINVKEVDVDQIDWTPPWPVGTEWKRNSDRKRSAVPYSREQIRKIRALGLANARTKVEEETSTFFYVNVLLLVLILGLIIYKAWPGTEQT